MKYLIYIASMFSGVCFIFFFTPEIGIVWLASIIIIAHTENKQRQDQLEKKIDGICKSMPMPPPDGSQDK